MVCIFQLHPHKQVHACLGDRPVSNHPQLVQEGYGAVDLVTVSSRYDPKAEDGLHEGTKTG